MDGPDLSVSAEVSKRGKASAMISMTGQAGVADMAWFRQLLELQAAHGPAPVAIDLSQLRSMDWWTALMLLWVDRVIGRRGGTLVLIAPRPSVARLLHVAGAPKVTIVRSYPSAIAGVINSADFTASGRG